MNSKELHDKTFEMKSWAVVGAHHDPARYGYKIFYVLRDHGFEVYPIHPRLKEIDGVAVHRSIADLSSPPDVVVMVVNPVTGLKVMEEIRSAGVKYVWMQPGTRSDEIRAFARENGVELIEDCVLIQLGRR